MTDDLQRRLREQLEREMPERPTSNVEEAIARGAHKRRSRWATISLVSIAVAGASIFALGQNRDGRGTQVEPVPATGQTASPQPSDRSCPRSRGRSSRVRFTSSTAYVASGKLDGSSWMLCARTAESSSGTGRAREGLCMDWAIGDSSSGMGCVFTSTNSGEAVPLDENYFSYVGGPDSGYFYGAVPGASSAIELRSEDGASVTGTIHAAPKQLGVPFSFFTLFAEPYAEGALKVRDQDGAVIRQTRAQHGLSLLAVTRAGAGEGDVVGYRTELLEIYQQCRSSGDNDCREPHVTWINCGDECEVALDDARITLVARPAQGSRFVGWSGDCRGSGRCELTVDRPQEVEAVFEAVE